MNTALNLDISKLEGIKRLLRDLDNPEKNFKIIHVAGTNGKGLTATMVSRTAGSGGLFEWMLYISTFSGY